jgi:succinate dehydrogenase/fumarate reductase flavoprotein subunit
LFYPRYSICNVLFKLIRCHEAKAMATCAELLSRTSLIRTNTQGSHIKEDYPNRDDKNWLKWIIIRREGEEMELWTESINIEEYKLKPS